MKTALNLVALAMLMTSADRASATAHYVDVNSTNAMPPYTNWVAAATNIQDAVDAALAGDEIVVTNGFYAIGERVAVDSTTNRVTVDKPVSLRSVNGPQFTVIDGAASVRCVSLTNGASLSGFTLTHGRAPVGGGLWCESENVVVTNCVVSGNSSFGYTIFVGIGTPCCGQSLGSLRGIALGYTLAGGVYSGTLYNCTVSNNWAETHSFFGFMCDYRTCSGVGNGLSDTYYSLGAGGGAANATLDNCILTANRAIYGGGAYGCTMNNCTLTGNTAAYSSDDGQAFGSGGGAYHSVLNNCISYFNTAADGPNYDSNSTLNYCCTTPQSAGETGNISVDPQLATASHLSAASPCRGAGSTGYASGSDIDGETWASSPSIGCDEYHSGSVTGPLSVGISPAFTNLAVGFGAEFTGLIEGRTTASTWDFGDGTYATNQPYTSHAWTAPGDYTVVLRAYNESWPASISATVTVHVVAFAVHYVAAESAHPEPPYSSWATAATNIQDAVDAFDAALVPGALVLVTNGTYAGGGRAVHGTMNHLAVDRPVSVQSVNGPESTVIDGGYWGYCAYLGSGASLAGFTLTNGGVGGVFCESRAAVVVKCLITGNHGRGAFGGTLDGCFLSQNTVFCGGGGGASDCTLNNCTLTGNSADYAGGATNCTLNNCIICYNTGGNYDSGSTLNYCCTTPLPIGGVGNISLDPQLASGSHLSAGSPCRSAGSSAYASGTDIDGEAWGNPPSIGCDEYHAGDVIGPLSVAIRTSFTNVAVGYTVQFAPFIEGRTTTSSWDFGDGTALTNQPYSSHAWKAPGDYGVVLRAYNESQPGGTGAVVIVHVVDGVHYVALSSVNPVAPYASWATAATNIQDAVDAATAAGSLVLVTNGIYATGGSYSRVAAYQPLMLRSVNGPQFTVIDGGGSKSCADLGSDVVLSGFTLTNGASNSGGGAYGGTLNNCTLTGNSTQQGGGAAECTLNNCTLVRNSADDGGGAYDCTLNDCTLVGNSASSGGGAFACTLNNCTLIGNQCPPGNTWGGGAYGGTLNNCTLVGNSAFSGGGGAYYSTLNNCIVQLNSSPQGQGANYWSCTLNYCCTTPLPTNGVGNITSDPLFVDTNARDNLRLQSNSPCINAGRNAFAPAGPDLDGNPRIQSGTVDIGAYEFQSPTSTISYAWLQQYNLPIDGSADTADPDGDGMNNWQEWRCGTVPTNSLSALRLLMPTTDGTIVTVTWQSVAGVSYFLEGLSSPTASADSPLWTTNILGQSGTTSYTDSNAFKAGQVFYRVRVGN
jgi:hypothetical protein